MTNTIKKNAYRMLVLAVMALLMAVNLSQAAFACLTSETNQSGAEITKNPMECLVLSDEVGSYGGHEFINTCDEAVLVKVYDEDDHLYKLDIPGGNSYRHVSSDDLGVRWAACFEGERIEGFDSYYNTGEYSCVAE